MTITCPSCSTKLRIGDEYAGKTLKCPKCLSQFQAPAVAQQQNAGPLDQLASAASSPRPAATRRPVNSRITPRKSKAPAIIGAIAVIVVIGIIGAVFSRSRSDPASAPWEDVVRAYDGIGADQMIEHFRKVRRENPAHFRREIKARRKEIKASGLTCQEYGKRKRQIGEYSISLYQQGDREKKAIESEYRKRMEELEQEGEALKKQAYQIEWYHQKRGSEEWNRQKKLQSELYAQAKAARDEATSLSNEMYEKLRAADKKWDEMLKAQEKKLGW